MNCYKSVDHEELLALGYAFLRLERRLAPESLLLQKGPDYREPRILAIDIIFKMGGAFHNIRGRTEDSQVCKAWVL